MYAIITYNYHGDTETCVAKIKYEIKNMRTLLTNQKAYCIEPLSESWSDIIYSENVSIKEISERVYMIYLNKYHKYLERKVAFMKEEYRCKEHPQK